MHRKPTADAQRTDADGQATGFVSRSIESGDSATAKFLSDYLPHFVWTASADGRFQECNRPMRDYLGQSAASPSCPNWLDRVHEDERQWVIDRWQDAIATGTPFEAEFRLHDVSDAAHWFLSRAMPQHDADGKIHGWIGTCTDINAQKQNEESLRRAKELSDQNGRVKDEFLSILSHELRTPLSAILGWTQLLEMDALDEKEKVEAVQIIKQQAKLQSQLIEDLLEVSRIINGKFHMRRQVMDLRHVVTSAVEPMRAHAATRNITIEFLPADVALLVEGDPQRLQQLTFNLLTNAVKFSNEGSQIVVQLERDQSHVRFSVTDTGRGIPADQLSAIFDRFKQLDSGASRAHGGLGLGLCIARHIVERHNGAITAHSGGPGTGSTFTTVIPIVAVQPQDPMVPAQIKQDDGTPTLDGVQILVVDDEDSARTVVAACLRKFGATVQTAPGMTAAWELLKAQPFRVLISDMSMPVHDGCDLIRCVRASVESFAGIPSIALTGFASIDDQTRALDAGFNVHVTKPVDQTELVRQVLALARQTA